MIFYHFRNKVERLVVDNFIYMKFILINSCTRPKTKAVFLDITEIELNRYLSNLIKFFKLAGYTIYIPKNKKLICRLAASKGEFRYASFILKEDVKFGSPKNIENLFFITKEQLSNDYYNAFFQNKNGIYHVPMSQYPEMYYNSEDYLKIDFITKRKRSLFLAGNFNPLYYKNIANDGFFKILSRREIVDFMYKQKYYHSLPSLAHLSKFMENTVDFKVILIDSTKDFQIKTDEFKKVLKEFDFFMALPGIEIPQSHNLIEAMAMGCIPFIHRTYANLFYPPLQNNETAFIYETKQELDNLIKEAFNITESDVLSLRVNVLKYYKTYLSPEAVVESIVTNDYIKIIVQAENVSVNLLRKSKLKNTGNESA